MAEKANAICATTSGQPGSPNIARDLFFQLLEGIKFLLVTDFPHKTDLKLPTVFHGKVIREEMNLQATSPTVIHRGARPDVGHPRDSIPFDNINSVRRQNLVGHSHIRRRKANRAPQLLPPDDFAKNRVGPPKHRRHLIEVYFLQAFPDPRAANTNTILQNSRHFTHFNFDLAPPLLKSLHIAFASPTEAPIVTRRKLFNSAYKKSIGKIASLPRCKFPRKPDHNHKINSQLGEDSRLVIKIRKNAARRAIGSQHLNRVRIEGQNPDLSGSPGGINDSLMAKVDAVKDSQSQTKRSEIVREFIESVENLHAAMNGGRRLVSTF